MSCVRDIYFWRQCLILIGECLHSVGSGFLLSFSSVLNPTLLSANTTDIRATPEQVSSLSASLGVSGMLGSIIIASSFQNIGRKIVHISLNFINTIGFLILYFSQNLTTLFIGKSVQGFTTCGVTMTVIIVAEYFDPRKRGYFMTIKKATISMGCFICHSLYLTCTWRQIALLAIIPYTLSTILILFWPESPAYLAMKGKFEKCTESHIWLFGNSETSKKYLKQLKQAQMEKQKTNTEEEGIIPAAYTVIGEVYPLEYRGLGSFISGMALLTSYTIIIKFIPLMIDRVGVEGMFAIFATCLLLCVIGLYFILIETKDKTLQEIENEMKGIKQTEQRLLRSNEEC
ncbi:unnamed protein product [Leptosia nina]|uniref:Major facilitator superfamily (MFS) profile domain-containing protein n=1 Tax=Leptosia nina TaxID=320188 RepID=A0AAV1JBC4_9NEOP